MYEGESEQEIMNRLNKNRIYTFSSLSVYRIIKKLLQGKVIEVIKATKNIYYYQ